jgi:hypothetical chaperone protein
LAQEEHLAEERLRISAAAAGFEDIQIVFEPVAAAAAYRRGLSQPEVALIADIGAGTSDFSVARLEPTSLGSWDQSRILASSGVQLGGDNIDGLVMWHKLTHYFGRGTKWESAGKWLDVPARVFRDLCQWHRLSFLRDGKTRDDIDTFIRRSANPEGLIRLGRLIDRDLGYGIFRSIESAKMMLASTSTSASVIMFNEEGLHIDQTMTLNELREWLGEFEAKILSCIEDVLRAAGLGPGEINSVFITGGTSLLPPIKKLFANKFGDEKLKMGDPFDSVALGLLELAPS